MATGHAAEPENTLQAIVLRARAATVRRLVVVLVTLLILGVLPAVVDLVEHSRSPQSPGVARWAVLALLLAVIQLSYAVFLFQIPDWSSLWVVAVVMLLVAMIYALTLGVTLLAQPDSPLLQWFELGDAARSGLVRFWSFIMTSGSSLLTLACGVTAVRWRNQDAASRR